MQFVFNRTDTLITISQYWAEYTLITDYWLWLLLMKVVMTIEYLLTVVIIWLLIKISTHESYLDYYVWLCSLYSLLMISYYVSLCLLNTWFTLLLFSLWILFCSLNCVVVIRRTLICQVFIIFIPFLYKNKHNKHDV